MPSGTASIPLPTRSAGGSRTRAIHQPSGIEPAIGRPIAQNGCNKERSNSDSPGRRHDLEFLGPDHDVTKIDRARPRSRRRSDKACQLPWFHKRSQAATIAKNRPKKARPSASVASDIMIESRCIEVACQ